MLLSALNFLLVTVGELLTMLFLLRFLMQVFKTSFQNPLGMMVIAITDFAVKPARRLVPSLGKIDLATLLLAISTQLLLQFILLWLRQFPFGLAGSGAWLSLGALSLLAVCRISIDVFFYAILLQVILSWVNPQTPISGALNGLTKPILNPIRRLIPIYNGIDFSPIVALILLQMVNKSFIHLLEAQLMSYF